MNLIDEQILARLRDCSEPVSGEELCAALAVTRTAVWKHVQNLRQAGYQIDSAPRRGYRLLACPNQPYPCEVRPFLTTKRLGRTLDYLPVADSTNRQLAARAQAGAAEGAVLVADSQTAGRGRLARHWFSPPGVNLYFSLLLRPTTPPAAAPQLSLLAALALVRAVAALCPGLAPRFKWPNDVFLDDRKLSGILCDMAAETDRVDYLIVGVGINVNLRQADFPPELRDSAISLRQAGGVEIDRARLLAAFLNQLEPLYLDWLANGLAGALPDLRRHSLLQDRLVEIEAGRETIVGTVVGLGAGGSLLLTTPAGEGREILCGDVRLARPCHPPAANGQEADQK